MTTRQVICLGCGWASFAVTRAQAEQWVAADAGRPASLDTYVCLRCKGSKFRPQTEDDRIPDLVTLNPVIWEEDEGYKSSGFDVLRNMKPPRKRPE